MEAALEMFLREIVGLPQSDGEAYRHSPIRETRIPITRTIPREIAGEHSYTFSSQAFAYLHVPTMLLLGGDSPPPAWHATEVVRAALPESWVAIMPGEQHVAYRTNRELFLKEVLDFFLE